MRVFGLDGIPSRFSGPFVAESPVDAAYNFQMELRRKLAALGFYEPRPSSSSPLNPRTAPSPR
ncbi:MAG: hypothetical protein ACLT38_08465 [Akkermansia sp.]